MIRRVLLRGLLLPNEQRLLMDAQSSLQSELRCEAIAVREQLAAPEVCVGLQDWARGDVGGFDRLFASLRKEGGLQLVLWSRSWLEGSRHALELLTRYQRYLPLPLDAALLPNLAEILVAHRRLHTAEQACTCSSYECSLDTWRWVLRLDPLAQPALQLAALFSASGRQGAPHFAHALQLLMFDRRQQDTLTRLLLEQPRSSEHDGRVLNDARWLSFFSVSSWHYLRERGHEATWRRVVEAVRSMSDGALCLALMTRQPPAIAEMLDQLLGESAEPSEAGT